MTKDFIQSGLEQDSRHVSVRMPDVDNPNELGEFINTFKKFVADNGLTQAQIAAWIGYSKSVISDFVKGRYQGDVKGVVNKLVHLVNSVKRKQRRVKKQGYVSTTVAKRIGTMITQAEAFSDEEGRIGVIIGDGGHGKSVCLREYAKVNKAAIYIEYDDAMTSTMLFAEIAKQLRGVSHEGTLSSVTARLVKAMRKRHLIVLIDEASSLKVKELNRLRQVIVVKARCPLVLAGNAGLLKTLHDESSRRGYESLDQFNSRLMSILNLDELSSDDSDGLYTAEDIRNLYEYGAIKLTIGAVDTLRRICQTAKSGRLRTCSHIVRALHLSPVVQKRGIIDSAMILSAVEELGLPVRDWLPFVCKDQEQQSRIGRTATVAG